VVDHWKDDAEFCRQLIQGVNPLTIRMVRSLAEVPRDMKALSAQGKSLEALVEEQRLFILDYIGLDGLKPHRNMVFYAPIVLVYREILENGKGSRLNLLGIQLTRNEGHNRVYTRTSSPPNRYLYAKIQVACADNQYHQFINHLGYAHLGTEPMVIAHHNAFHAHPEHPIGKLLAPHFKETIGINYLARQTLVASQHAFTDKTFAPGTAQALQLFLWAWERYDFFANSFPEELRGRGFDEQGTDGVENYYYRDDGFKIWRALESYAKDVVYAVYRDDQALANDAVVQGWAWESCAPDRAAIPGFPNAIVTRAALVQVLTTILFQTSAFHSAVNFPQAQYLVYVPNRPDATLAKMPEGDADITLEFIYLNAMPSFGASSFQISFAILLTVPPDATIASDRALAKEFPEIYEKHQKRLDQIRAEIGARNDALVAAGEQPYPYLSPEQIAASVAI
jgi:arachidonate 5-lipoxygenase